MTKLCSVPMLTNTTYCFYWIITHIRITNELLILTRTHTYVSVSVRHGCVEAVERAVGMMDDRPIDIPHLILGVLSVPAVGETKLDVREGFRGTEQVPAARRGRGSTVQ